MSEQTHCIYEFGPFRLDATRRLLLRDGEPMKLSPKDFDTLLALVEHSGEVLDKDVLMKRLWGNTIVEEGNLATYISHLRRALGERPNEHEYIVTVPGQGYRFVAGVRQRFDELIVHERTRAELTVEEVEETDGVGSTAEPSTPSARDGGGQTRLDDAAQVAALPAQARPASTLISGSLVRPFKHHRAAVVAVSVALLAAVAAFFAVSQRRRSERQKIVPSPPFQQMEIKRVTASGKATDAAISPDGRYIAYVLDERGKQSIHLMQVGTNSSVLVRRPRKSLTASPSSRPTARASTTTSRKKINRGRSTARTCWAASRKKS